MRIFKNGFTVYWIFSCLLLVSCGSATRNTISQGDFSLNSGVAEGVEWNSGLGFKRTSWYRELSMVFDLYLAQIDAQSDFFHWFSPEEQSLVRQCPSFYIVLSYALNSYTYNNSFISIPSVIKKLEDQGLQEKSVLHFKGNLRMHPDFIRSTLNQYKIYGFCGPQRDSLTKIGLKLPGFPRIQI